MNPIEPAYRDVPSLGMARAATEVAHFLGEGPTWDPIRGRIFVRDDDPAAGIAGERRVFAELEHGFPDGMTMDAEGHLWVAVWGGGCVLRIAPDGRVVARVDVPAPHASCPAFAGPDLDVLVVTTATEHLTPAQLAEHPLSGRVFTFRPGVRGLEPRWWRGR